MDAQELRNLQEAYLEVYSSQELNEGSVADRARNAVSNQRLDDAQRDTQKSIDKLKNTPTVTRASASLAAKTVEGQVKKSAAYGPQGQGQSRGFGTTGAYRIEKPKPTGSKPNAYRIEKPKPTGSKPGASSSLGGAGTPSGTGRYTPGSGGRYGIAGIGLADQYDLYDIILSHLLDEGYADTQQAAEAIMVNMSEEWRESIVEESMPPRRSKEERSKRAKELGDRQTIRNVVGKYNKEKPLSKQENPDKYYSNN
jgi:hypothetical protein